MTWATASAYVDALNVNSGVYRLVQNTQSLGSGQAIISEIRSNLQDGSLVRRTRFGNRSVVQLTVMIAGTTSLELAQSAKALVLAMNSVKTLALSSYDGVAPAAVFDVHVGEYETVDLSGIPFPTLEANFIRGYLLTFTCQPFVRSVTQVNIPALATSTGTPTVISDGTTTTGWSGNVSSVGGQLRAAGFSNFAAPPDGGDIWPQSWGITGGTVTFTQSSANWTTTPFITIDVVNAFTSATTPTYYSLMGATGTLKVNGTSASLVAAFAKPGDATWQRLVFIVPGAVIAAVTSLEFTLSGAFSINKNAGLVTAVGFDNVTRTSVPPSASTTSNTGLSLFTVPGSERTPASLTIQGGAGGNGLDLDDVVIYTSPTLGLNGYTPDLRQWSSSPTTANQPFGAHVPAVLLPRGTYLLAASFVAPGGSFSVSDWSVQSENSSNAAFGLAQTRTTVVTPGAGATAFAPLGMVSLPPTAGANIVDDKVAIGLPAVVNLAWQNVYVFHLGDPVSGTFDGAVSWARASFGSKLLTLNSPDLSNDGEPEMYWSAANGTNQRWAGDGGKLSIHSVVPPQTMVWFLATGAATKVGVAASLFPRYDAWPDQ